MSGGLDLTIALPGLDSYTASLSRLRADIADWRPFWTDTFGPFFARWVRDDFIVEGGQSGASWAPLSPAYAVWKAKRFPGAGLLVRSGALKAALTQPGAPYSVFRPTSTALEIGTSLPYAIVHQRGSRRIPQRPPLRVNAAFMGVVGKSLQIFIQRALVRRRAEAGAFLAGNLYGLGGA